MRKNGCGIKERWNKSIYPGYRFIVNDILCAGHAVYEYAGSCKKRNPKLEMANYSIGIHDGAGLRDELYNVSDI